MLEQPWKYFEDSVNLVLVTHPAYSAPSIGPDEGPFQIGTVAGLRYPSAGFKPAPKHAWSTALSQTGKPLSLDQGAAGDSWEASVDIEANQAHAAALVAYLQGATARGQTITLTPGADYYPFGAEQASTGAMSVVLTDNVITIKNDRRAFLSLDPSYHRISREGRFWRLFSIILNLKF